VSAVRLADVVISTVGVRQIPDQTKLVAAIKEAGNVKVRRPACRSVASENSSFLFVSGRIIYLPNSYTL